MRPAILISPMPRMGEIGGAGRGPRGSAEPFSKALASFRSPAARGPLPPSGYSPAPAAQGRLG